MELVAVVVAVVAVLATYLTWTAERIDRLNVRVERAAATLDAHLVRRSAAAQSLAAHPPARAALPDALVERLTGDAEAARDASRLRNLERQSSGGRSAVAAWDAQRTAAEDRLTRDVHEAVLRLDPQRLDERGRALLAELVDVSGRVDLARTFYNQAVRDTRELRSGVVPRALHLAGRARVPSYVEIDDTTVTETDERQVFDPRGQ